MNTDDEVFDAIAGYQDQGTGFGEYAEKFILDRASKLGIAEEDKIEWAQSWHKFSKKTQCIESDCDYDIGNDMEAEGSSATGAYQFLTTEYGPEDKEVRINEMGEKEIFIPKNPVQVAKNRAKSLGVSSEFLQTISDNPMDWTEDQSDVMFIANIAAQNDSDAYVIDVGKGNMFKETYSKFHHTKPDKETFDRMNKYFIKEK